MNYQALFQELADNQNVRPIVKPDSPGMSMEQCAALNASLSESAVIIAGAGAGKTKLLVERAARLVKEGTNPAAIAVVTFTRKAADEVQRRLMLKLGNRKRLPVCATIHALALRQLAQLHGQRLDIASAEELETTLEAMQDGLPDEFEGLTTKELLLLFNRCREEGNDTSLQGLMALRFERMLAQRNLADFSTVLKRAVHELPAQFSHIIVDEAQDISHLQMNLLHRLGRPGCAYWYVGDPDQAIYAFRGAHDGIMAELERQCEHRKYILSANYRSARLVVEHANNVLSFCKNRFPVKWVAHRSDEGRVIVECFDHASLECAEAARWVQAGRDRMVLARTQALVRPLKEMGLPACSVHESKGLEWSGVWLMGCEASLFPHILGGREEERRLFYVAMTRAKDQLVMSCAASRGTTTKAHQNEVSRTPSPFLFETQGLAA